METNHLFKKTDDRIRLDSFFKTANPGEYIRYEQIADATGVEMGLRGKAMMRLALKEAQLEYLCDRGKGIQLGSTETTMPILATRMRSVGGALTKAHRSHENLREYSDKLPEPDQQRYRNLGETFGAMIAHAELFKREYLMTRKKEKPITVPQRIPLPQ